MMGRKIENMDQLKAEIERLEAKSAELKSRLLDDVEELKEELKPANLLIDTISGLTRVKFSRETFSKNGFAENIRSIIEQVIQKAGKTVEDRAHGILDKVFDRLNGFVENIFNHTKKRRPEENYFDGE